MDIQASLTGSPTTLAALLSHPSRANALEVAIAMCKAAWSTLNDELLSQGYDEEALDLNEGSRYDQYCEWDGQILEDADAVYHNSTAERQQADDRDLEHFETYFEVRSHFSPRINALALRTLARDLVAVAEALSDDELARALYRVALNEDGTVDLVRTCRRYAPYFAIN